MAHYAFITAGVVTEVIVGRDEDDLAEGVSSWENYYATKRTGQVCKRTSYNTYRDENGVSHHLLGGTPFRGQYAGIGDIYDAELDEFVTPPVEDAPE
jgi:hypothetical protein